METKRTSIDLAATASFPKTGKRGVPQQFPRRLYEMLEMETARHEQQLQQRQLSVISGSTGGYMHGTAQASLLIAQPPAAAIAGAGAARMPLISWSPTGRAFHISDSKLFAEQVLPSYFRTSKFSSFQRNLNLYGFSKVRRGPDMDMYAHPSFMRGKPENLVQLRKLTTAADRQRAAEQLAESVAQHCGEHEQQLPRMYPGVIATNPTVAHAAIATAALPMYPVPKRSVSVTSNDYFSSSSFSAACYDTSATSEDSEENGSTANVATGYNGISISDLIQTYQKGVDARTVSSSSSVASSVEVSVAVASAPPTTAAVTEHRQCSDQSQTANSGNEKSQHNKRRHSADSLQDNKLALLAFAMTSMAGQELP